MRRVTIFVVAGVLAIIGSAQAQEWSKDEAALFAHIRLCWEGYGNRNWDEQVRECGLDPALLYWWAEESEPRGIEWMRKSVEEDWPSIHVIEQEFTPIRVTQHGETHFVFYRGARTFTRSDGPVETVGWIGMEVWRRTGVKWRYLGGMGTPTPSHQGPEA